MKDKEKLIEALQEASQKSPNGKISCTAARALQARFEVENGMMARICDELDIRINACELGCFD